jgi:hypothetical protein
MTTPVNAGRMPLLTTQLVPDASHGICTGDSDMAASSDSTMPLQKELETFKEHLPEWKEHEGKFALIHSDEVVDFFSSYEDAIKIGYSRFGLKPFLVKRVHALEQIQHITRLIDPCSMRRVM